MISGDSRLARRARRLLSLLLLAAPDAAAWGIEQLMQDLAQVKSAEARFVERRYLAILTAPLESSGTLTYIAPHRLEKHTLAPRTESLVLERGQLTLESGEPKRRRTIRLEDYPVIGVFVESIRSTLAGDLDQLNRLYGIALEGDERKWRMVLRPGDPKTQEMVSEIRISGSRNWIGSIEFLEAGGDRSVMTITRDAR
jgi:hypothetical protein